MRRRLESLLPFVVLVGFLAAAILANLLLTSAQERGLNALEDSIDAEVQAIAGSQNQRFLNIFSGTAGLSNPDNPFRLVEGSPEDLAELEDLLQLLPDARSGFYLLDARGHDHAGRAAVGGLGRAAVHLAGLRRAERVPDLRPRRGRGAPRGAGAHHRGARRGLRAPHPRSHLRRPSRRLRVRERGGLRQRLQQGDRLAAARRHRRVPLLRRHRRGHRLQRRLAARPEVRRRAVHRRLGGRPPLRRRDRGAGRRARRRVAGGVPPGHRRVRGPARRAARVRRPRPDPGAARRRVPAHRDPVPTAADRARRAGPAAPAQRRAAGAHLDRVPRAPHPRGRRARVPGDHHRSLGVDGRGGPAQRRHAGPPPTRDACRP